MLSTISAIEHGRRTWPAIQLSEACFRKHLTALGYGSQAPRFGEQLYLACAAIHGDPHACQVIEQEHLAPARTLLLRFERGPLTVDDFMQDAREKLWLGVPPALRKYRGQTPLARWIALLAKRRAIDRLRQLPQESSSSSLTAPLSSPASDSPEVRLQRAQLRAGFAKAVCQAFQRLTVRESDLLRQHYGRGLSTLALGRMYNVHRATSARWLTEGRTKLIAQVRTNLRQELALSSADFDDLALLLQEDGDFDLRRWLSP